MEQNLMDSLFFFHATVEKCDRHGVLQVLPFGHVCVCRVCTRMSRAVSRMHKYVSRWNVRCNVYLLHVYLVQKFSMTGISCSWCFLCVLCARLVCPLCASLCLTYGLGVVHVLCITCVCIMRVCVRVMCVCVCPKHTKNTREMCCNVYLRVRVRACLRALEYTLYVDTRAHVGRYVAD
jgi:hypothetical protein